MLENGHHPGPTKKANTSSDSKHNSEGECAIDPDKGSQHSANEQTNTVNMEIRKEHTTPTIDHQKTSGDVPTSEKDKEVKEEYKHVYVWDLDETLIIFACLLIKDVSRFQTANDGKSVTATEGKDISSDCESKADPQYTSEGENATDTGLAENSTKAEQGHEMGLLMEQLIFHLADKHMYFDDLQVIEPSHIECVDFADDHKDLTAYDFTSDVLAKSQRDCDINPNPDDIERDLAYRLRNIKQLYNSVRNPHVAGNSKQVLQRMRELLPVGSMGDWRQTYDLIDELSGSWMTLADLILSTTTAREQSVNVMVTSSQLIPAMSKIMLYGLTRHFRAEDIYASRVLGKEECFRKIQRKYGDNTMYHAIGDSSEEIEAGKKMGWNTHLIRNVAHLKQLLATIHMHS